MSAPSSSAALSYVQETAVESVEAQKRFLAEHAGDLVKAAEMIATALKNGGKVLIFGNGGSAADAQHMAAEMVGRMLIERRGLPAIALTTDSSNLTAIGNDYGYDHVFERQVEALARPGDLVLAISTSGKSRNVLKGVAAAHEKGCKVIGLTGGEGGELAQVSDLALIVRGGKSSSRIQETHIFAIHSMVDVLDRFFLA